MHGVAAFAHWLTPNRVKFFTNGYSGAELYATTYGEGKKIPHEAVTMKCEYVKQVKCHSPYSKHHLVRMKNTSV